MSAAIDTEVEEPLLELNVTLKGGQKFQPEAAAGYRIMELMRAFGLPIKAECGGSCICASCHVRIPKRWQHLLPPPSEEELAKLDEIPDADETSRLACQIVMTEELNGLELELQPDSMLLQTAWVAG